MILLKLRIRQRMSTNQMNKRKILWGIVLVLLGTMLLLDNLNLLHIEWSALTKLWPVFFILMGINLIFRRSLFWVSALLLIVITLISLIFSKPQDRSYIFDHKKGTACIIETQLKANLLTKVEINRH